MQNAQIADILEDVGTLIELQEDNPFRARAYHNAARIISNLGDELATVYAAGKLDQVPGLGKELRTHVIELLTTGHLTLQQELRASIPSGLIAMLRINGLGPKRIRLLHDKLGIESIDALADACKTGKVAEISGLGAKTQANILKQIELQSQYAGSFGYVPAYEAASAITAALRDLPGVSHIEVAGSLRRCKETVHDVDAVASVVDPAARAAIMDAFTTQPQVQEVIARGDTKSTIMLADGLKMDLRVVNDDQFAAALHHFTGSKDHHIALRGRANRQGLSINEYGIWREDVLVPVASEEEFYRVFGMDFIPPEMREDRGEIEAALRHELPELITESHIMGALHCHSTWSDGKTSIREMAEACRALGYQYFGICDHSQVAAYAHGLTPDDVRRQHAEIDALNSEYAGAFTILKGTECDILKDGKLDYDDATLARFDFVVASIHSQFQLDQAAQTERLIRAIENPYVTILGHLTGRILLQREGYPVDIGAVIEAAAKRGVAIELNANPARFDLDWRWHKVAIDQGVFIPIDTDAHSPDGLRDISYGIGIARKGWIGLQHVPNAWPLERLRAWFTEVRQKGGVA
jgi:DNA polymerase (family X)